MANEQPIGLRIYTEQVTAAANIPAKTLMTAAGAVPADAATAYGVTLNDVGNGEIADVVTVGLIPVIATGTVTKGSAVEALRAATFTTKDGTNVTGAGVQNYSAGVKIGYAHSDGSAGDVVLIELAGVRA